MNKLRISHTFLLLWSQGRINEALDAYYHRPVTRTPQMEAGIEYHKAWAEEIQNKKQLTLGKTTFTFKSPECEKYMIAPLNDEVELSGMFDCIDNKVLYEWKTGVMSALEYVQGYQLGIYFLMAHILGIEIDRGVLGHLNQYEGTADVVIVRNTEREREKARNFIESLSPEIVTYFEQYQLPFDKTGIIQ